MARPLLFWRVAAAALHPCADRTPAGAPLRPFNGNGLISRQNIAIVEIIVSSGIRSICPGFVGACVEAEVENPAENPGLGEEMSRCEARLKATLDTEGVKSLPPVEATRRVYRLCGKDPSRYRPAAEALMRRVLQGKGLYRIGTLVDLVNLASMESGYSIGGFDAGMVAGPRLTLGIGREGEPYEGIGRGSVNIAGLPVYRDGVGGIGTPTCDHERTKITPATSRLLCLVNGYDGDRAGVERTALRIAGLCRKYAAGAGCRISFYGAAV